MLTIILRFLNSMSPIFPAFYHTLHISCISRWADQLITKHFRGTAGICERHLIQGTFLQRLNRRCNKIIWIKPLTAKRIDSIQSQNKTNLVKHRTIVDTSDNRTGSRHKRLLPRHSNYRVISTTMCIVFAHVQFESVLQAILCKTEVWEYFSWNYWNCTNTKNYTTFEC